MQNLIPCITRATHVKGNRFTKEMFEKLYEENKKVYLFDGTIGNDENVKCYIQLGQQMKVNEKYLTSKRTP